MSILSDVLTAISDLLNPLGSTPGSTSAKPMTTRPPAGAQYRSKVSVGDLPWAVVMMPTTSSGQSGIGINKHGLHPESWVVGFFADGDNCQQPIIVGTLPGGPGKGSPVQNPSTGATGILGAVISGVLNPTTVIDPIVNATTGLIENISGTNIEKGMNILLKFGYTAEQAAGILGCLQVESGPALKTTALNKAGGGQGAFGIAQWRGDRQKALKAYADQYANGEIDKIEVQLSYLVKELKEMPQYSGKAEKLLQNTKTPQDAAIAFAHYERGEDYSPQAYAQTGNGCQLSGDWLNSTGKPINTTVLRRRIDNATKVYQSFANAKK